MPEQTEIKTSEESNYDAIANRLDENMKNGAGTGNIINILTKYDWSVNYHNANNAPLPVIYLNEYRQNLSTFAASLNWGVNALTGSSVVSKNDKKFSELSEQSDNRILQETNKSKLDNGFNTCIGVFNNVLAPYQNMYSYAPTNIKYVFPYFETPAFNLNNSYTDSEQSGSSILGTTLGEFTGSSGYAAGAAKFLADMQSLIGLAGAPSLGMKDKSIFIERPKFFQYDTTMETVRVKFTLYNTLKLDAWRQNYSFIKSFIFKNSPYKLSVFKYKTPVLYELIIPGVKYYPVSYVSSFSATNLGTMRIIANTLVPEAWQIEIVFQSLLNRSANLIEAATGDILSKRINITIDN